MTLVVDLFDPNQGRYAYLDAIEDDAAGFESYRTGLWGSALVVARGARFLPQLAHDDLFVYPEDLPAFADECRMLHVAAEELACALWKSTEGAESIRRYLDRFLTAIALAESRGAGVTIS